MNWVNDTTDTPTDSNKRSTTSSLSTLQEVVKRGSTPTRASFYPFQLSRIYKAIDSDRRCNVCVHHNQGGAHVIPFFVALSVWCAEFRPVTDTYEGVILNLLVLRSHLSSACLFLLVLVQVDFYLRHIKAVLSFGFTIMIQIDF